jgi:predicted nucleic acid-binding protein
MKDKVFIDTNILIYAYSEEEIKRERSLALIKGNNSIISIQVINEFVNVIKKKFKKNNEEVLEALEEIEASFFIWDKFNIDLTKKAINLSEKFNYSYYDCLILAAALNSNCSIVYSEDMHHNHLIEEKLKIVNPFLIIPPVPSDSQGPVENNRADSS